MGNLSGESLPEVFAGLVAMSKLVVESLDARRLQAEASQDRRRAQEQGEGKQAATRIMEVHERNDMEE
eukprot:765775-Hanusia_phi.AAC.3